MHKLHMTVRSTHFVVRPTTHKHKAAIREFNKHLVTSRTTYIPYLKKKVVSNVRHYYYNIDNKVYHYSIHLLSTFIKRIFSKGITKDNIVVDYDTTYVSREIECDIQPTYSDRDHQYAYIDKAINTNPMVLIDLKTGKGKTYISMRVVTELKQSTGIIVLSRYIEKWISDVQELTTVDDKSIYVVKGRGSLIKLLQGDKGYDFVIFSLSTLYSYIKAYDKDPGAFEIAPEEIFKCLGLGMMICDEVHQSFHAVYMTTIRLNPMKVISLSATLDNLDQSVASMYHTLYPKDARCGDLVKFDAYPVIIASYYMVDDPNMVKCVGPMGYSHVIFEQYMLRRSVFRNMYLDMIFNYVKKGYIDRRETGDKLLILVQTVKLATLLTNYLRHKLKDLVINRYVEEDPYDNIINSDISVSTNLSAGTALDIPNLITVIQTVSIRSLQANVQSLGRLREIKGREVRYYYVYGSNIPQQYKLHVARKGVLSGLAKEYRFEEYQPRLKVR